MSTEGESKDSKVAGEIPSSSTETGDYTGPSEQATESMEPDSVRPVTAAVRGGSRPTPTNPEFTGPPPLDPEQTQPAGIGTRTRTGTFEAPATDRLSGRDETEPDPDSERARNGWPTMPGYMIHGELGRGGMGRVYRAHHLLLDRAVALKVILDGDHASDDQRARFLIEAQAVAHLLHPNIVQIFEISETNGLPYFSLEFVDGGSLEQRVNRQPQEPRWSATLVETLSRAMHTAHSAAIIHRDLKPANVLLTRDGTPKITDFGLAKRLESDSGQTRTGSIMGTPTYMSPEQAWGRSAEVGPRSDIYSIGAILYTLITGRPPFQGTSAVETLEQVRTQEPVSPSTLQPKVPRDLETICLKCLEKEPVKRYETALALADDLHRFLQGDTIVARPVSTAERVWRLAKRNPKIAVLATSVLFLLAAVAVISTTYAAALRRSNQAFVIASEREKNARLEAEASVKQAFEQNRSALDAWKTLGRLTIEDLKAIPAAQNLRQKFLDEILQGLRKTADGMEPLYKIYRRFENAGVADFAMAGVHKLLADELLELGQTQDAREHYTQMNAIAEAACTADPRNLDLEYQLANSRSELGNFTLKVMGDSKTALSLLQDALRLRRHRLAVEPDSDLAKRGLASALGQLAMCHQVMGELALAKRYFSEEEPLRESLSPDAMHDFETRRELSGLYDKLGSLAVQEGDVPTARRYYDRCYSIRKDLAAERPSHLQNLRDLSRSLGTLGELALVVQNDPGAAGTYYEESLKAFRDIHELEPTTTHKADVASGCYFLATALLRLGQTAKAHELYRECLTIRRSLVQDPEAKWPQIGLAMALARCGEHEEAARIARRLVMKPPLSSEIYVEAACALALCSGATSDPTLRSKYAQESLESIRMACAEGWKDFERFKVDPDLDPIRGDPRFQRLLQELQNPATAAAAS